VIRPEFSKMDKCLESEGLLISKRSAISPAVRLVAERYARIRRRGVEARAEKILSKTDSKINIFN